MAAPRPWFRLGSFTRQSAAATTTPVTEQPRPVPARIRPPLIRPAAVSDPSIPSTPKESTKSPPRPAAPQTQLPKKEASPPPPAAKPLLTKPVVPLPSSGDAAAGKPVSPAKALVTKPVVPLPSSGDTAAGKPGSPAKESVTKPVVPSPSGGDTAGAKPDSPTHSEPFKDSSQHPSPVPSPSPESVPAVVSPFRSPKPANALPPSPLVLPPAQLPSDDESKQETIPPKVEKKSVVFQKVMEKPTSPQDNQNGKQELKKNDIKLEKEKEKEKGNNGAKKAEEKDSNPRFITMTGENRGASMEVILSSDKNNNNNNKNNKNIESQNEDKENKNKLSSERRNARPMEAFCNSNVQGINNSILMNSKFSHHDPGIHLVFSTIPSVDDEDDNKEQQ